MATISSMRKNVLVCTALILSFFCGCRKSSAKIPPPPAEKLTLQDLKSPKVSQNQPQILFELVTFELPAEKVKDIENVLSPFNLLDVRIGNKELFPKNGLSVFSGKGNDGDSLVSQLRSLEVKRIMRTSLITMDKADEFFATTAFPVDRYMFSILYGDRKAGQTLRPGQIGFMITPGLTVRKDSVHVKIVPTYVAAEAEKIGLVIGNVELGRRPFEQGKLEVMMQEGDFLILAPIRVPTETTLDKMLFGPEDAQNKMRLYVILFVQVVQE